MKQRTLLLVSVLILTLALAACSANTTTTAVPPTVNTQAVSPTTEVKATIAPSSAGSAVEVAIANFSFAPNSLTIKEGTTVKWTNQDSVTHTVTSDTGLFDSGGLSQGQSFSYTFTTAGTYPYHCTPHQAKMTATVIVTK